MELIYRFGEITTYTPNQDHIKEMRQVCDHELENGLDRKECNNLYEVYYYLKTGHLSGAWRKINKLEDKLRAKVPKSIYENLKEICKDLNISVY